MSSVGSNSQISTIDDGEARLGIGGIIARVETVSSAIQLAAAVLDKRIATARAYPRVISRFKREAEELLTQDIDTARQAEYAKPVGKGVVRGPSVRLAELAAMCWGNLDVECFDPVVTDKSVSVKAAAWDLEKNNRQESVVSTAIQYKDGSRYPQHLIETTAAATAAKARRNAILLVIPRAFITNLLVIAKHVANKQAMPLAQARQEWLDYFGRTHKVKPEQVFAALGIEGADDMGIGQIDELQAIKTAIEEGAAVAEFFASKEASKADELKAKIAERKAGQVKEGAAGPPAINGGKAPAAQPEPTADHLFGLCQLLAAKHNVEPRDAIAVLFHDAKLDAGAIDDLTPAQLAAACQLAQRKLDEPVKEKPKGRGKAEPGKLIGDPDAQKLPD